MSQVDPAYSRVNQFMRSEDGDFHTLFRVLMPTEVCLHLVGNVSVRSENFSGQWDLSVTMWPGEQLPTRTIPDVPDGYRIRIRESAGNCLLEVAGPGESIWVLDAWID